MHWLRVLFILQNQEHSGTHRIKYLLLHRLKLFHGQLQLGPRKVQIIGRANWNQVHMRMRYFQPHHGYTTAVTVKGLFYSLCNRFCKYQPLSQQAICHIKYLICFRFRYHQHVAFTHGCNIQEREEICVLSYFITRYLPRYYPGKYAGHNYIDILSIFSLNVALGATTSTISPTCLPISALPIGDVTLILPSLESASCSETIW